MAFTKTDWNEGAAPGISAAELNRIEEGIAYVHADEVEASIEATTTPDLTGTESTLLTVQLTIPSNWGQWRIYADAQFKCHLEISSGSGTVSFRYRIQINGNNGRLIDPAFHVGMVPSGSLSYPGAVSHLHNSSSTGTIDIHLRGNRGTNSTVTVAEIRSAILHARAKRIS